VPHWLTLALTVYGVIFLLELPDKTALAALLLATRHRPVPVFIGTAAAFVIQSAVAVFAGSLLGLLPHEVVRIGAGVVFLAMAAVLVRRNLTARKEERDVHKQEARHHQAMIAAFTLVFLGEWGDLSQLGTAALQARYQDAAVVFGASLAALWTVSGLAVALGNRLGRALPERPLQYVAAAVMTAVAILLITGVLG
jgi:putative Ca2+/H+ antiporter (TMEM165/GDT1 family)